MSHKYLFVTEDEYRAEINNIFNKFTINKDENTKENFLDVAVMEQIFIALGKPLSTKILNDLKIEVIKDNLLGISYKRFEEIYIKHFPYNSSQLLKEAFEIFDVNHTGRITFDDMKKVVNALSLQFTDQVLSSTVAG